MAVAPDQVEPSIERALGSRPDVLPGRSLRPALGQRRRTCVARAPCVLRGGSPQDLSRSQSRRDLSVGQPEAARRPPADPHVPPGRPSTRGSSGTADLERDGHPVQPGAPDRDGRAIRHLIVIQTVNEERELARPPRDPPPGPRGALRRMPRPDRDARRAPRARARLQSGADLAGLAHYEIDYARGTAYADDRFFDLCGTPPGSARATSVHPASGWITSIPDDRARVLEARELLHAGQLESSRAEYRYLHPTQGQRWIHHLATCLPARFQRAADGLLRRLSRHHRTHPGRRGAGRPESPPHPGAGGGARDDRPRAPRRRHPTARRPGHRRRPGRACGDGRGAPARRCERIREELGRVSEDVHSLAYELHSSVLDELGLVEALRTACERLRRRRRVEVRLDLDPTTVEPSRDSALCLFRVAQEALNNVSRHSGRAA